MTLGDGRGALQRRTVTACLEWLDHNSASIALLILILCGIFAVAIFMS